MPSLFVFGREGQDAAGNRYSQSATILASDADEAAKFLIGVLGGVSTTDQEDGSVVGLYADDPEWKVEEIPLDASKVISVVSTKWPNV